MPLKLTYFELNGLAEGIRYILHYTGQKFEDVRHDLKTWPIKEIKDSKFKSIAFHFASNARDNSDR